jgi:DNA modification methylase
MTAFVIQGDAMHLPLPDECVDLVVTSPPYFGLRSYTDDGRPVPNQVGGEAAPGEFIDALITATAEMVRVLKPGGSIFLNLGDRYVTGGGSGPPSASSTLRGNGHVGGGPKQQAGAGRSEIRTSGLGIPTKSLMLLPERYRIAAVDRLGLIARAVIVWDKPNGLPESVLDRVRRSHEDWVHLTKQPRYFSAIDEIREPYAPATATRYLSGHRQTGALVAGQTSNGVLRFDDGGPTSTNPLGKLPGSVWRIPTAPLTLPVELGVDHFAAFPPEWPKRIIQGWSPAGVCVECGEGRRPTTTTKRTARTPGDVHLIGHQDPRAKAQCRQTRASVLSEHTITGYACECPDPSAPTTPGVVLDPFGGTGTTMMVAHALGRIGISVDLSHDYCRVAQWRATDRAQMAKVRDEVFRKPEPQAEGQDSLFTLAAVTP